ncbi:MAG: thiamine pyrophosphate-dependent enzyme, partial [Betaproteobacteria bacterium]
HIKILQISERDHELGKNYPAEVAIRAHVMETTSALNRSLDSLMTSDQKLAAHNRIEAIKAVNWSTQRLTWAADTAKLTNGSQMHPNKLILSLVNAIPENSIVVEEALSSSVNLLNYLSMKDHQSYFGLASGGIGFAMAGAIGISLAQPNRPVIALIGDGSSMYSIQALWTAAHMKLPITYVIANNKGYRIIKQRLKSFRGTDKFIGMDFNDPEIDFVKLAQSMGVNAQKIHLPEQLEATIKSCASDGGTHLIEVDVLSHV